MVFIILLFAIFALLIMAYCKSPTANVYFKSFWIFMVIASAGFVGTLLEPYFGLNSSITFSIAAATVFLLLKPDDE